MNLYVAKTINFKSTLAFLSFSSFKSQQYNPAEPIYLTPYKKYLKPHIYIKPVIPTVQQMFPIYRETFPELPGFYNRVLGPL